MIYILTLPIIIYITLQITILNKRIQLWKASKELHYPRKDKGLLFFVISKVLNCSFCLSGHLTWISLLMFGYNLILIPILTLTTMHITRAIERKLLWK